MFKKYSFKYMFPSNINNVSYGLECNNYINVIIVTIDVLLETLRLTDN